MIRKNCVDENGNRLGCEVEGCENPINYMGMCAKHTGRFLSGRDLHAASQHEKTYKERFMEKVDKRGGFPASPYAWDESMGECWNWTAARRGMKGTCAHEYGAFRMNQKQMYAHRAGYEIFIGPIPEGLSLDHLCRNTLCVNPSHMEPCTLRENQLRREGMRTHCKNGHEMSKENTVIMSGFPNRRYCRRCRADASKKYAAKKRALARTGKMGA